jgi:hypothetical protein
MWLLKLAADGGDSWEHIWMHTFSGCSPDVTVANGRKKLRSEIGFARCLSEVRASPKVCNPPVSIGPPLL